MLGYTYYLKPSDESSEYIIEICYKNELETCMKNHLIEYVSKTHVDNYGFVMNIVQNDLKYFLENMNTITEYFTVNNKIYKKTHILKNKDYEYKTYENIYDIKFILDIFNECINDICKKKLINFKKIK